MKARTLATALTMGMLATALTGCIGLWIGGGALAGGAATGAYLSGDREVVEASLNRMRKATALTLDRLGYGVVEEDAGADYARFKTLFKDGARITVKLKAVSPEATKVRVWVGVFGTPSRSAHVLSEIKRELGKVKGAEAVAVPPP